MVQVIQQRHLDFVHEAKEAFKNDPAMYTYRDGTHEGNDTLIALRYGMDRDCILIYELDECIANFVHQLEPAPIPRKEVMKFAHYMEKQLKANDHKGGWQREHHRDLISSLICNLESLRKNLFGIPEARRKHEITRRCANIASYAMMIADNEGEFL